MDARARAAYGVDVLLPEELARYLPAGVSGVSGARECRVTAGSKLDAPAGWQGAAAVRLHEQRHPDGTPLVTIDRDPHWGYRIWAREYGEHFVTMDGRRAWCRGAEGGRDLTELLLFGRTLPLVATLLGLELLHASAVVLGDRAVAFVGESGAGKSSIVAHLVAQGAGFLADDVLAIERGATITRAHPGPRLLKIPRRELRDMSTRERANLGPAGRVEDDKVHVHPPATGSARLTAVYFVDRARGRRLSVEAVADPARALLGASYVFEVATPERLVTQLDVCSAIARSTALHAVTLPEADPAGESARRLAEHALRAIR